MRVIGPPQSLEHATFGRDVIQDMRALYGGTVMRHTLIRSPQHHLYSPDGSVHVSNEGRRPAFTAVNIKDLDRLPNAQRWTALQAYRAKGGVALTTLTTEVPGLRAHHEHSARVRAAQTAQREQESAAFAAAERAAFDADTSHETYTAALDQIERERAAALKARLEEIEAGLDFFTYTTPGAGNDPNSRFFDAFTSGMEASHQAADAAARNLVTGVPDPDRPGLSPQELFLRSQAIGDGVQALELPEELPHTHTNFQVRGTDLLSAAQRLAAGYGELTFHADDPDTAVANALGAPSLERLAEAWGAAMEQATPLAAGTLVLNSLTREG